MTWRAKSIGSKLETGVRAWKRNQNGIQAVNKGLALAFLKYKRKEKEICGYISKFIDPVIKNWHLAISIFTVKYEVGQLAKSESKS